MTSLSFGPYSLATVIKKKKILPYFIVELGRGSYTMLLFYAIMTIYFIKKLHPLYKIGISNGVKSQTTGNSVYVHLCTVLMEMHHKKFSNSTSILYFTSLLIYCTVRL